MENESAERTILAGRGISAPSTNPNSQGILYKVELRDEAALSSRMGHAFPWGLAGRLFTAVDLGRLRDSLLDQLRRFGQPREITAQIAIDMTDPGDQAAAVP